MSPPGRPKGEYRSAQREGTPVSAAGEGQFGVRYLTIRRLEVAAIEQIVTYLTPNWPEGMGKRW
jgi:hypothetical protein